MGIGSSQPAPGALRGGLFGFLVLRVLVVPTAKLLLGDLLRVLPLVAKGGVVDAVALGALQVNDVRHASFRLRR